MDSECFPVLCCSSPLARSSCTLEASAWLNFAVGKAASIFFISPGHPCAKARDVANIEATTIIEFFITRTLKKGGWGGNDHLSLRTQSLTKQIDYPFNEWVLRAATRSGSIFSGLSIEPNRCCTWPSRLTRNLVKFHLMASVPRRPGADVLRNSKKG